VQFEQYRAVDAVHWKVAANTRNWRFSRVLKSAHTWLRTRAFGRNSRPSSASIVARADSYSADFRVQKSPAIRPSK